MLAKKRDLNADPSDPSLTFKTPLLVPSFSSKGFPDLPEIIALTSEVITEVALVSAYDVYHEYIPDSQKVDFSEFVFLDSGGYEAARDHDYSEANYTDHEPDIWDDEKHRAVLEKWAPGVPSILITYDHPTRRIELAEQIREAADFADRNPQHRVEILVKPETKNQSFLQIKNILSKIDELAQFTVIGVTEKELGSTHFKRMRNIARIRGALEKAGADTPIHVFGSLDPISTPLYFLAGADIFDGLTWLRFAYRDGLAVYIQNQAALTQGLQQNDSQARAQTWYNNYYSLENLRLSMAQFATSGDFSAFRHHAEVFERAHDKLHADIGE